MTQQSMRVFVREHLAVILTLVILTSFCYLMGYSLIIPFCVAVFIIQIFYSQQKVGSLLIASALLLLMLMVTAYFFKIYHVPGHLLPIASVAMLTMLLFNNIHLTFLMAILSSVVVGLLVDFSLGETVVYLMASACGAYHVRHARKRGVLLTAGMLVALIQFAGLVLVYQQMSSDLWEHVFQEAIVGGLISGLFVLATLHIFELLFDRLTNFSLLELTDSSHPLLKRLLTEAPGSYHHSMIVASLAEAAAERIGADALLTRVGAYYHDVGKTQHPEYFTENQERLNKHDVLDPNLSRLVILNHVKEGVDIAREYRLNRRIIDFIPEHHGTSLIYYFYQKALTSSSENIDEDNFRYPGPKPQSKETAIVMLADSVEGATRVLDEHTPARIEEMVRKVINNKFIDGQLDECALTLREINLIAATFVRVLTAMYHHRVKYPQENV